MQDPIAIFITTQSFEEAKRIAHTLVEENLVACTNVIPTIQSVYRWEEKICDDSETLLICKSKKACLKSIVSRVKELHSYDVPEIIALPITGGNPDYLTWVDENTL